MKKLYFIFVVLLYVMFSFNSFAGWTKVGKNTRGDAFYVDYERIRKVDGYVYYWELTDFVKQIHKYWSS